MSTTRTHYQVLHISASATQGEIEQAHQRLMARIRERIAAGEAPSPDSFAQLEEAFAVLRDPVQRAHYDASIGGGARPRSVQPATSGAENEVSLSFSGSGGEYFRIWIVNLLLSIITFGIYSAWAKVRREQYFHRNTLLDGSGFEYHATPSAILKGRIMAVIIFSLLSFSQEVSPFLYIACLVVLGVAMPWLLMCAYRFRARNTSYRGLHFSFDGTYGGAFKAFVGYGLLTIITVYLLLPLWVKKTRLYVVNNLRYGHGQFVADVPLSKIYKIMFAPVAGVLLLAFCVGFFGAKGDLEALMWILVPAFFFGSVVFIPYVQMKMNNLFWGNTALDQHQFHSSMRFGKYLGIVLKNWFLIMLTLGLYWPWARVGLYRYRLASTSLTVNGSLDEFVATASQRIGAMGDETAELFDLDVGF